MKLRLPGLLEAAVAHAVLPADVELVRHGHAPAELGQVGLGVQNVLNVGKYLTKKLRLQH